MYSPKIDEALIPRIYRAAKAANVPMTTWVNRAVEVALPREETAESLSVSVLECGKTPTAERLQSDVRIPA
jgi:hypothetical protein